jgi:glyoxylase-like metal-dependent hydrolase (beta-lactamase superfamily II)
LNRAIVKQVKVGAFQVFTYIVACSETRKAVVIDPAGEEERLLSLIKEEAFIIEYILNTHGHADHLLANERLKEVLSIPTCMHELEIQFFSQKEVRELTAKELGLQPPGPADEALKDGDILKVGTIEIKVIHTPGHTPGSVCYLIEGNLFTGDTLFVGAAGRTDLTGGSLDMLLDSIEKKILTLPKETVLWPGHDYGDTPSSTLGREMEENVYITDFILDR